MIINDFEKHGHTKTSDIMLNFRRLGHLMTPLSGSWK